MAWERYRLDPHRQPIFERGDGAYFLARLRGRPAGRVTAHVAEPGGEGRFGFWWTIDDRAVATALVDAAAEWLREQGCTSMTGPLSFTADDELGVQAGGFSAAGLTGRPWHPPHLARLLEDLGFEPAVERRTWRLAAGGAGAELPPGDDPPGHAGPYGDDRLVVEGIAAVPDVSRALRSTGVRSAWGLARRARERAWTTCAVVRCSGAPELVVPALLAAAGRASYEWVVAPWSPESAAPPEAVHRTYRRPL
jgi:GNAT superfamily N-acetyltransferase